MWSKIKSKLWSYCGLHKEKFEGMKFKKFIEKQIKK